MSLWVRRVLGMASNIRMVVTPEDRSELYRRRFGFDSRQSYQLKVLMDEDDETVIIIIGTVVILWLLGIIPL